MRIHHLNCISMCPIGGRLMDGYSSPLRVRGRLVCHCLLLETARGLVLVDTGFGLRDVRAAEQRLSKFFLAQSPPERRTEMTAVRQVEQLGFSARDVRHIVLTHLDFDHAGGLDDFPHATVHLLAAERDHALARPTWLDRQRFRPQQWSGHTHWKTYEASGEAWFGFDCVRSLDGLADEVLLVPLIGHTYGHCGVAVDTGQRWLLHAGDAYFFHAEMDVDRPRCPIGLRFYQWMMEKDRRSRLLNQQRLRELKRAHDDRVTIFCAHDVRELERHAGHVFEVEVGRARQDDGLERSFA